tara:strand:- start:3942 stop:4274 length:333 start_codon:yes stop_codon:yes gene_type:complete
MLMVVMMGIGILQLVSYSYRIQNLWLTSNSSINLYCGIILLISGPVVFFLLPIIYIDEKISLLEFFSLRNINDIDGGIAGFQQSIYFCLSLLISLLLCKLSSFITKKFSN